MKVSMFIVRIWDLPTRLFHWILVGALLGLLITGNVGADAMVWHFRFGYMVLTLLLFRLIWGFCGGHWSRWSQLPLSPAHVWAYVRGRVATVHLIGHNPLGSWSVLALLFLLGLQVITGLFSDDEISTMGPLSSWASSTVVGWATAAHKGWGKLLLLALIGIHLFALIWYRWRKHPPLVPAMLHGNKSLPEPVQASRDNLATRSLALFVLALSGLAVAMLVTWIP